jgi:Zn-dependent membrane protease YugP
MLSFVYFDFQYLLWMAPFLLLSMWAAIRVKGTFAKYSQVQLRSGVTGAEAARMILRAGGMPDVQLQPVPGMLTDHYDPRTKVVALSEEVMGSSSAGAVAVAAHECGHALQHAAAYAPMQARAAMVPVVNFANAAWIWVLFGGMVMHSLGLIWAGIILGAAGVLFHVVTLPVEFDASRRAFAVLSSSGIVAADEMPGVRKTLYAAGFTYIAGALSAIATLVYFIVRSGVLGGHRDE